MILRINVTCSGQGAPHYMTSDEDGYPLDGAAPKGRSHLGEMAINEM